MTRSDYAIFVDSTRGSKKTISKAVRVNYKYYFKCSLDDQDKKWTPLVACKSRFNHVNEWKNSKWFANGVAKTKKTLTIATSTI